MLRISSLLTLAALASGCATTSAVSEQRSPYPREKGRPVTVPVLGSNYTFPANLDLVHYVDRPGIFGVELVDRVTGCEGLINFETTSDPAALQRFTNEKSDELKRLSEQRGLSVAVKTEDLQAAGQKGRVVVLTITNPRDPNDAFYFSRFELFLPSEAIAYHGYVECAQNPLRAKTMDVARNVIASRAAPGDTQVAAGR